MRVGLIGSKGTGNQMEKLDAEWLEQEKGQDEEIVGQCEDRHFSIEEIRIEEMTVDGICGVY